MFGGERERERGSMLYRHGARLATLEHQHQQQITSNDAPCDDRR